MKAALPLLMLLLTSSSLISQNITENRIPFLGETAPGFEAESTLGKIKFPDDFFNKWRVIISHPGAFTPVCTSELIELAELQQDFKKINAELIVVSTDGVNSNLEWIKSMHEILYKERKTKKMEFPIVSDLGFDISRKYGMQHLQSNSTKNIRGVFIIDPDNKIRIITFYPSEVGRNTDEILRSLTALQESDKQYVLTPANWKVGDDFLLQAPENKEEFETMKRRKKGNQYHLSWYMWFRKN